MDTVAVTGAARRSDRDQLRSPSRIITAGSNSTLITVASSATATARPTPSCLKSCIDSVPKTPNTATMMTAALVTAPAADRSPCITARSVLMPRSRASLIRETTNTW